jgi:hypothetical protein
MLARKPNFLYRWARIEDGGIADHAGKGLTHLEIIASISDLSLHVLRGGQGSIDCGQQSIWEDPHERLFPADRKANTSIHGLFRGISAGEPRQCWCLPMGNFYFPPFVEREAGFRSACAPLPSA